MRPYVTTAATMWMTCSMLTAAEPDRAQLAAVAGAALPGGARVWVVDNGDAGADDAGSGDAAKPMRTIQAAAKRAEPGDMVLVFEGVYRERISPVRGGQEQRPIIYAAAPGQRVVVKGSEVWRPQWQAVEGQPGVFAGELDASWFEGIPNPYHIGISIAGEDERIVARPVDPQSAVWRRTLGQVFVDGEPYQEVESPDELQLTTRTWLTDADGTRLLVHFPDTIGDPATREVEISVRNRLFAPRRRGLAHIHVRGFVFEHCANQGPFPQGGAVSVRSGNRWVIEHNTIRHAKTVGLDCGSETWGTDKLDDTDDGDKHIMIGGRHLIAHNTISDNGLCGIAGWNHQGTTVRRNVVERNNNLGFVAGLDAGWWEQSAIKMHNFTDGVIEENLVRDNDAFGIWIDNGYNRARISRNIVVNNQLAGIFLELGHGQATIDNNVIAYTRGGDGIYCHDASGVTVAHNLLYHNANFGVWMHVVSERQFGKQPVETSDERIVNNLFVGNHAGAICLPLPSTLARNNVSDHNAFIDGTWLMTTQASRFRVNNNSGRIDLGLALKESQATSDRAARAVDQLTLDEWRQLMSMDQHSQALQLDGKTMLRARRLHLDLGLKSVPTAASGVAGIERDLYGRTIDPAHAMPGPSQDLKAGRNSLYLWPLPQADR